MKNTRLFLLFVSCLVAMTMQAQTKACMSYDDFKALFSLPPTFCSQTMI